MDIVYILWLGCVIVMSTNSLKLTFKYLSCFTLDTFVGAISMALELLDFSPADGARTKETPN